MLLCITNRNTSNTRANTMRLAIDSTLWVRRCVIRITVRITRHPIRKRNTDSEPSSLARTNYEPQYKQYKSEYKTSCARWYCTLLVHRFVIRITVRIRRFRPSGDVTHFIYSVVQLPRNLRKTEGEHRHNRHESTVQYISGPVGPSLGTARALMPCGEERTRTPWHGGCPC